MRHKVSHLNKFHWKHFKNCLEELFLHIWSSVPWILKRGWLEGSGRRLISSMVKTKRIAFLFLQKKYFKNCQIFWEKKWMLEIFPDFFLRIGLNWRLLVEFHISNIEEQRGYFFIHFYLQNIYFWFRIFEEKKGIFFLDLVRYLNCLTFFLWYFFWRSFLMFWIFWDIFALFLDFLIFCRVTKVTSKRYAGYYWTPKWPKIGTNRVKR